MRWRAKATRDADREEPASPRWRRDEPLAACVNPDATRPSCRSHVRPWSSGTDLGERLGVDVDYRRGGNLRLARTPAEVGHHSRHRRAPASARSRLDFLPDNAAVRAVAPALSHTCSRRRIARATGTPIPSRPRTRSPTPRAVTARRFAKVSACCPSRSRRAGSRVWRPAQGSFPRSASSSPRVSTRPPCSRRSASICRCRPQVVAVVQSEPLPPTLDQVFGVANADCAGRQEVGGRLRFTNGGSTQASMRRGAAGEAVRDLVALVAHVLPIARPAKLRARGPA